MRKQTILSNIGSSIIPSLHLLRKNDPLRLAGATAFFTTFALPFIVFILAQFFRLFLSPKIVGRGLIENIAGNIGQDGANQVRQVIRTIRSFNNHWYIILFGFLFLLFVATTLFLVIKNSINQIWSITVERHGLLYTLTSRLRSFAIILSIGILFFLNLFFESIETIGGNYTEDILKGSSVYFKLIFNKVSGVIIVTAWFVILFRFLADGKPRWKAAIVGGLLTSILFTIGRVLLKTLLINSNIGRLYGTSGSFVLLLLFVFYSSFILYYGASFIAVYSEQKKWVIKNN